ncbi:MAG: 30S ribosomal protein S3ae [Candidatus Thermoplasmatota archaeon]|nr:30S ribosomal protein S3ae [Candidatus Thermoplasmatota archaeon]
MAKARSRTAARKIKDKWKAKSWYNILAPPSFDNVTVADTLSDNPDGLINRVTEVSLQDLTNDFRKSHIKLFFKIYKIEESNALTQYTGHTLTSDYLRRMIRRKRSKIDGVYDVTTRDGAVVRVKPFATTDKRIQNSQRKIVRETMKKTISNQAKTNTLAEFIKNIIDGKVGSDVYKNCKKLYPVKRVEIHKTQVLSPPTIKIEEEKTTKTEEPEDEAKEEEPKDEKPTEEPEQEEEPAEPKDEAKEEPKEEKSAEDAEETKKKPKKTE